MKESDKLLLSNKAWANERKMVDPDFFRRLESQQRPHFLWIGCSDSRVPANEITGTVPGEVFVHRNIANVVVPSDLNCLSVIQFAVEVLKVRHIIVCGHYGCGGVRAAMSCENHGLIDNWLRHIRNVHRLHADRFEHIHDEEEVLDRLCELNVVEQVHNVCATTIIQDAWDRGEDVLVEGWVYSIRDGILKGLCSRSRENRHVGPQDPMFLGKVAAD